MNLHSKAPTWRWRVPIKSRHMFVCFHLSNHKFNVLDWSGWMPLRMVYNSIQRPEIDIAQPPTTTVLLNSPSFQPKLVGGLSTESNNTRMELHIHMMTFLHSVLMWSDNTSSDSMYSMTHGIFLIYYNIINLP